MQNISSILHISKKYYYPLYLQKQTDYNIFCKGMQSLTETSQTNLVFLYLGFTLTIGRKPIQSNKEEVIAYLQSPLIRMSLLS